MQATRQFWRRLSCPLSATHSRSARTTSPCATFGGFKVNQVGKLVDLTVNNEPVGRV
jgi:hypothetical protein